MTFATLDVSAEGDLGRLELDRPGRLNAMNVAMLEELAAAAAWFDDRGSRVVVISGRGRAFCAGADLDENWAGNDGETLRYNIRLGGAMAGAIRDMDAVTIAALHGRIVGGGVVLASSCDLRVAASDAVFSIPEVDLGIPLGWDGLPALVSQVGATVAAELILTCRPFDAAEAAAIGFVNRVVPEDDLAAAVDALAHSVAGKPSRAVALTKRQLRAVRKRMIGDGGDDVAMLTEALQGRAFGRSTH